MPPEKRIGPTWLASFWLSFVALLGMPSPVAEAVVPVPGILVTAADHSALSGGAGLDMLDFFPNPNPRLQAVGGTQQGRDRRRTDRHAYLRNATELQPGAPGIELRSHRLGRNFGTYELVELLQQVGARFDMRHPGSTFVVGDLSRRRGGTIRNHAGKRVHSSHRNGLDVDVMYLWRDCATAGDFGNSSCPLDVEENLQLMRDFVAGGPRMEPSLVDVMFVGAGFQFEVCRELKRRPALAEQYADVLSRLQLMGGHRAHFHVRLRCPALSKNCPVHDAVERRLCKR